MTRSTYEPPTPTPPAYRASRCARCAAAVMWARTEAGKAIPLDPDPVEPTRHGALCVVGSGQGARALGRVPAARRIAEIFNEDEPAAYARAQTEYPWHIAHFATCPGR